MMESGISASPFTEFRKQCRGLLIRSLEAIFPDLATRKFTLDIPPNPQFGELSTSLCFDAARTLSKKPLELAKEIEAEARNKKDG